MTRIPVRLNRSQRTSLKNILSKLTRVTSTITDVDIKVQLKVAIDSLVSVLISVKGYKNTVNPTVATKAVMLKQYGIPYKIIAYHFDLSIGQLERIFGKLIHEKRKKRRDRPRINSSDQGELF